MYEITADELETMVKAREILDKHKHAARTWVAAFLHNAVVKYTDDPRSFYS